MMNYEKMWETLESVMTSKVEEKPNSEQAWYYSEILELMKFIEQREVE